MRLPGSFNYARYTLDKMTATGDDPLYTLKLFRILAFHRETPYILCGDVDPSVSWHSSNAKSRQRNKTTPNQIHCSQTSAFDFNRIRLAQELNQVNNSENKNDENVDERKIDSC